MYRHQEFTMLKKCLLTLRQQHWRLISLCILLLISVSIPQTAQLTNSIRNISYDFYQRMLPRPYQAAPVKIIAIDDESLIKMGQFPWSRLKIAELITKLNALSVRVIAFDMLFSEVDPRSPKQLAHLFKDNPQLSSELERLPDNDEVLATTIKNANNIVTSFMLSPDANTHKPMPKSIGNTFIKNTPSLNELDCLYAGTKTLDPIENAAKGNATISYIADVDGVIRNVPLFLCAVDAQSPFGYRFYPTLSMEALRLYHQQSAYHINADEASGAIDSIGLGKSVTIHPTESAHIWLHYTPQRPERYIPAWKIFENKIDKQALEGHIVFIGVTATNLFEIGRAHV